MLVTILLLVRGTTSGKYLENYCVPSRRWKTKTYKTWNILSFVRLFTN